LECGSEAAAFIQHDEKLMILPSESKAQALLAYSKAPSERKKYAALGETPALPEKHLFGV